MHTYILAGLEDVKRKTVRAPGFDSVAEAFRLLRPQGKWRAVTTASDHGAISLWIDDKGKYRASRYFHMRTMEEHCVTSRRKIAPLITAALRRLHP